MKTELKKEYGKMAEEILHEAKWWEPAGDNTVKCLLCPRACTIPDGACGFCKLRKNCGGRLMTYGYGRPAAVQIDPIEKKPLVRFLPGTKVFSLGTFGCNLKCLFCQNHEISRGSYGQGDFRYFSPEIITGLAMQYNCRSVAFTYNEPGIFGEYVIDCARVARAFGLKTVLVSNGYLSRQAAEEIYPLIDAANFDVKAFSEEFYASMCSASLAPVLENIRYFHNDLGGHTELTWLVIPGKNDSMEMIDSYLDWVESTLGKDVTLHFSAYHPDYVYTESPPTPPATLYAIRRHAAEERGFPYISLGNI